MKDLSKYPSTDTFRVKDTIGVPHPYCIGSKHVVYASDHNGGILSEAAIIAAEKRNIYCETCKGKLSYAQHEQALLVAVKSDKELKDVPGLHEYLLQIKSMCEADGYAGFAFIQE